MNREVQRGKAETFRALHRGPNILVVGSVWDPASARVFEHAGCAALATSSAGLANALGFADGEGLPLAALLDCVRRIVACVEAPVSVDFETGYGDTPDEVAASCRAVLDAGGIGVNIEDGSGGREQPLFDAALQVEKIRAIRAMADEYGVPLFINARTDGYWLKVGDDRTRVADSIRRCNLYREAGADGVFVPGVVERDTIATLVREIDAPLNVLAVPGCPPVPVLQQLGVARLSQGSGPARACLTLAQRIATELLGAGTYTSFHVGGMTYEQANALFVR